MRLTKKFPMEAAALSDATMFSLFPPYDWCHVASSSTNATLL